jgi:hypothetical protein
LEAVADAMLADGHFASHTRLPYLAPLQVKAALIISFDTFDLWWL